MTEEDSAWCQSMVDELECVSDRLTDWELEFVDSVSNKLSKGWNLSERTVEKLEEIYGEKA